MTCMFLGDKEGGIDPFFTMPYKTITVRECAGRNLRLLILDYSGTILLSFLVHYFIEFK